MAIVSIICTSLFLACNLPKSQLQRNDEMIALQLLQRFD